MEKCNITGELMVPSATGGASADGGSGPSAVPSADPSVVPSADPSADPSAGPIANRDRTVDIPKKNCFVVSLSPDEDEESIEDEEVYPNIISKTIKPPKFKNIRWLYILSILVKVNKEDAITGDQIGSAEFFIIENPDGTFSLVINGYDPVRYKYALTCDIKNHSSKFIGRVNIFLPNNKNESGSTIPTRLNKVNTIYTLQSYDVKGNEFTHQKVYIHSSEAEGGPKDATFELKIEASIGSSNRSLEQFISAESLNSKFAGLKPVISLSEGIPTDDNSIQSIESYPETVIDELKKSIKDQMSKIEKLTKDLKCESKLIQIWLPTSFKHLKSLFDKYAEHIIALETAYQYQTKYLEAMADLEISGQIVQISRQTFYSSGSGSFTGERSLGASSCIGRVTTLDGTRSGNVVAKGCSAGAGAGSNPSLVAGDTPKGWGGTVTARCSAGAGSNPSLVAGDTPTIWGGTVTARGGAGAGSGAGSGAFVAGIVLGGTIEPVDSHAVRFIIFFRSVSAQLGFMVLTHHDSS
jgi:hypothetical protein